MVQEREKAVAYNQTLVPGAESGNGYTREALQSASEINTVLPSDTSLLGIWEGEDCCTLVTCTPYGVNTHRLLVTASRIPYENAEQIAELTETEGGSGSHWMQYYLRGLEIGLVVVAGFLLAAFLLYFLWKWVCRRWHHG